MEKVTVCWLMKNILISGKTIVKGEVVKLSCERRIKEYSGKVLSEVDKEYVDLLHTCVDMIDTVISNEKRSIKEFTKEIYRRCKNKIPRQ